MSLQRRASRLVYLGQDRPLWFLLPLLGIVAATILLPGLPRSLGGQGGFWGLVACALLALSWYRGRWGLYALAMALPLFGGLPHHDQSHYLVLLTLAFLAGAYGRLCFAAPRFTRLRAGARLANRDGGLLLIALWLLVSLFGLLGQPVLTAWRELQATSMLDLLGQLLDLPLDNPLSSLRGVALNGLAILVGLYAYLLSGQRRAGIRLGTNLLTALVVGMLLSVMAGLQEYLGGFDLGLLRQETQADPRRFVLGFFVHPSLHAAYLVMLMPVLPVLLCRRQIRRLPQALRILLLMALLILGEVCLILSMQGGAWVAYPPSLLLIWVAFYYVLNRGRNPSLSLLAFIRNHWLKVLVTLPISISLSVYAVYGLKQYQQQQGQTAVQVIIDTTHKVARVLDESPREQHWLPALQLYAQNPIYGGGGESYAWQRRQYAQEPGGAGGGDVSRLSSGAPDQVISPENQFLQVLVGRGTLGFLVFLGLLMLTVYRLLAIELGFLDDQASPSERRVFAAHLVRLCTLGSLLAACIYGLVQEVTLTFNLQLVFWIILCTGLGATLPPRTRDRRELLRHSFGLVLLLMLVLLPFHVVHHPEFSQFLSDLTISPIGGVAGLFDLQDGLSLARWALGISLFTGAIYLFVINHAHNSGFFIDDIRECRVQQVHRKPTPRIGGIGLFMANLFTIFNPLGWKLILCALPAFVAGIMDDYRTLPPKLRLLLQASSALLGILILDALIRRIGFGLTLPTTLAVALTLLAIPGLINAINIIDGFNGLASGVALMILISLTSVAWGVGDLYLAEILVINIAGLSGFLLLNYPRGRIFLGDGGSYYLGFLIAILSVLLISRHDQVSPLYPLVICAYPVFEVLFSIYRRKLIRRTHATAPDHIHLHSLIYRRWTRNNPKTSLWIWCGVLPFIVAGTFSYRQDGLLLCLLLLFVAFYVIVYRRLARHSWKRALIG